MIAGINFQRYFSDQLTAVKRVSQIDTVWLGGASFLLVFSSSGDAAVYISLTDGSQGCEVKI